MDYEALSQDLVKWIKDWFVSHGNKKAIIGMSGGAKSYIVATALVRALGKSGVIGIVMRDDRDAELDKGGIHACEYFGMEYYTLPVFPAINAIKNVLNLECKIPITETTVHCLPTRIRMSCLYAIAESKNGLVVNTNCLSDFYIGNAIQYGDSAGDVSPFGFLTVTEMRKIGMELGLSEKLAYINPDSCLPGSKPDEDYFGFRYFVLDNYIRTGDCLSLQISNKIDELAKKSKFRDIALDAFNPNLPIYRNE